MRVFLRLAWVIPGLVLLGSLVPLRAADPAKPGERTVIVAKCVSESGSFLRRDPGGTVWKPVFAQEELFAGDFVIGSMDSALESINGAITVANKSSQPEKEPFPVLETAMLLQEAKDGDLALTLERGRIRVTNTKKTGSAKVRITIRDRPTDYELLTPGDSFAIELYGRWPAGVPFKKDAAAKDGPPIAVVFLALKGEIKVKTPKVGVTMKAPPGQALFITDNLDHDAPHPPEILEKLPEWAQDGEPSEHAKKIKETLAKYRKMVMNTPVKEILKEFINSDNPYERRAAIVFMGATDDLEGLGNALINASKHPDVWDNTVLVLRHWIGRGPGQDQKLYQGLIEKRGFTPVQAAVLNLLHSFGEEDLAKPETYELLIDYLESDKLSVRGLAHWHLIRLVPQGQKFGYDALAAKDKRDAAVKEWRKYIPPGKLPPK